MQSASSLYWFARRRKLCVPVVICDGSGELPLQVSRAITDAMIRSLISQRRDNVKQIRSLAAGTTYPAKVGNYIDEYTAVRDDRFNVVMIAWADANEYARERGVKSAIASLQSLNRFLRSHGRSMFELAMRLHGTALIPVEVEQKAKSERKGVRAAAAARKRQLETLARAFDKGYELIREIYLTELPKDADGRSIATEAQTEAYYGAHYPHEWTAKRRTNVLAAFTGYARVAEIVTKLDTIVAEHKATKGAK